MNSTIRLLLGLVMVLGCKVGATQNLSNKGKEFWVGYGHHQFMEWSVTNPTSSTANSQEMVIYLSAEQTAKVRVSIYGTPWFRDYIVPAGTVVTTANIPKTAPYDARYFTLPPSFNGTGGEGKFEDKSIHIVSDVPITAYAHIYGNVSSGATMLMPVETWGYAYTSVNSNQIYGSSNFDCYSWMYVIAQEDNTVIEITPTVPTRNGLTPNVPITATLNKGDAYQIIGAATSKTTGHELSGTKVRSIANTEGKCYPIAAFSGSSRTGNPFTCGTGGGDNDMQQLFPSQAWGKRYLTAPTSNSANASTPMTNMYKILVKDPNTTVKVNGQALNKTTLIRKSYYTYESKTADYIEADQPVMVAQYMNGSSSCMGGGGQGDPEMVFISPVEQGIKQVAFFRNTEENINVNYLTLIIPTNGFTSLTIDGQPAAGTVYSYSHPRLPGYSVVVKRWNAEKKQSTVQSDSAFTAITYGLGGAESYAFNAGTMINNLNILSSIHNELDQSVSEHKYTCNNTPVKLGVRVAYQPTRMVWKLSALGNAISPNADVTIDNPVPAEVVTINGVTYYRYQLPDSYTFANSGDYEIPIISSHPSLEKCDKTEEIKFTVPVRIKPQAEFTFTHSGCVSDTVYFSVNTNSSNGFGINKWSWMFPDGSTSDVQNPKAVLSAVGINDIRLKVISSEGCVGETTQSIQTFARPTAAFDPSGIPVCEGGNISLTDKSSVTGGPAINVWHWDFGNGTPVTINNNGQQTVTYPAYGKYTVKHVVKSSETCVSDTVSKVVTVFAKPNPSFTYPAGCLSVDGVVQFKSTTTTPDGQALASYAWNFGDAAANVSNPNTSTLENPSHAYSFGSYEIKYSTTTVNGCSKDTMVRATFNIKAVLAYPELSAQCESVVGTVSVAKASVTNGVPGNGYYKGPTTDSSGQFTPAKAGAGIHTVWYIYTTTGGCTDSVSQNIQVYPKPIANFTVASDICINGPATINDKSTLSSGNLVKWNWNFGEGTPDVSYSNNSPITKTYTSDKMYTVKLVASSDKGCVSDTISKTITVHPLPKADFDLPAGVCMPNGSAQFTNKSIVTDNSSLGYQWNFGDGSVINTSANPSHTYSVSGSYKVQLIVQSAYGCVKDTTKVLSSFYDKPIASFRVTPETLCQGTDNVFTNLSTAPNSTIQAWNWSFADGSSSNEQNPVKKYSNAGNYNVTLTVTNAVGCVSDPFTKPVLVYVQPVVDAGPSFVVPQGTRITFNPKVNDSTSVTFRWTPGTGLSNPTVLRPSMVANASQTYTLTARGDGNCTATDFLTVKILLPVKVPNAFSPNGDGINDAWEILNLFDYPGATIEVFNRYGQPVYRSAGYQKPWDGTINGKPLPFGTYYYVITLKNGFKPITGSVTIVR